MSILKEEEIPKFTKCCLLNINTKRDPFYAANLTLTWAIRQSFYGKIIPIDILRKKFVSFWSLDRVDDKEYFVGIRLGNKAAKVIFLFLKAYEVLKPVETYVLPAFGLSCSYAIIQKRVKSSSNIFLLQVFPKNSEQVRFPDIVAAIKWFHAFTTTEYSDISLYNLPLFSGQPWKTINFNEKEIKRLLMSFSKIKETEGFVSSGDHCIKCVGKLCKTRIAHA